MRFAASCAYFLAFHACWVACVIGAGHGLPALGPAVVAGLVVLHLVLRGSAWKGELVFLGAAGLLGYLADSAILLTEMMRCPPHAAFGWPAPLWMVTLWIAFAAVLRASMKWLSANAVMAGLTGAVAGPLSYHAGVRLGALEWNASLATGAVAVAIEWGLSLPLLGALSRHVGNRRAELS